MTAPVRLLATLARAALALAVLSAMLGSAGCGRKAMPEPRRNSGSGAPGVGSSAHIIVPG